MGPGSGWAYASTTGNVVSLTGLLGYPLLNMLEGDLSTSSPNSLFLTLSAVNIGGPLQQQLIINTSVPGANAGAVISFAINIVNVGSAASAVTIVAECPNWTDFVSASGVYTVYEIQAANGSLYPPQPFIRWDNIVVPPQESMNLYYQVRVRLPTASGPPPHQPLGGSVSAVTQTYANQIFAGIQAGVTQSGLGATQ